MIDLRQPTQDDLVDLIKVLEDNGVEYVVIGGAAMALHGYARMTKDIDLLLPVDPANNARLLTALRASPALRSGVTALDSTWMDKGHSTELTGEISVDLLFVAADKPFELYRTHAQRVRLRGVELSTLDVDGMILSKRTSRERDRPDVLWLERLKTALYEDRQRTSRVEALPELEGLAGTAFTFGRLARQALDAAGGDAEKVDWKEVESEAMRLALANGQEARSVGESLIKHSPGVLYRTHELALWNRLRDIEKSLSLLQPGRDPIPEPGVPPLSPGQ